MEFEKVLLSRKSCRSYQDKPVEAEKLEQIAAAGAQAPLGLPSACKPMLTIITDPAILTELQEIYQAPALIVVSCPPSPALGIAEMNAACVVEMMSLMATNLELGNIYLYAVIMELQGKPELLQKLSLPEGYTPLAALGVGYGTEKPEICKELVQTLDVVRL